MKQIHRRLQQSREWFAGLRALRKAGKTSTTTLWIGDSHARFNLGQGTNNGRITAASPSNFVWSIGPRLAFSIAKNGWPPDVVLGSKLLTRCEAPQLTAFVLGEIDVRMFLSRQIFENTIDLAWIPSYLERCIDLSRDQGRSAVIVVPIPPSARTDEHLLPEVGSIQDRIEAHRVVREAIARQVALVFNSSLTV
ncbi:MAG: hypothetical protein WCK23_12020, partial [Actinomycetes bacterium]